MKLKPGMSGGFFMRQYFFKRGDTCSTLAQTEKWNHYYMFILIDLLEVVMSQNRWDSKEKFNAYGHVTENATIKCDILTRQQGAD